jgi:hypothetical protein
MAPKREEISYSGLSVSRTSLVKRRTRFFLVLYPYKLKKNKIFYKRGDKGSLQTTCSITNSLQQKDSALLKAGNSKSRVGSLEIE